MRTKLSVELEKGPCRKFLQDGTCRFGAECRFSHLQDYQIAELRHAGLLNILLSEFSFFLYLFLFPTVAQVEEETCAVKLPSQLCGKKNKEPTGQEFVRRIEDKLGLYK